MVYDLIYSKIITLKLLIFIISLFIILFIFLNYYTIFFYIQFLFLILLFCFFFFKEYQNYLFISLNIIILFLIFKILLIDRELFFLIVFLSFINDTFAFIVGKNLKGPLIASYISPKKTWSGTLSSFLISFSLLLFFQFNIIFSIIISISFFLGDLFFSYFKRQNNIKDFSNLLHGHGGFLDRFDSIFLSAFTLNIYVSYFK